MRPIDVLIETTEIMCAAIQARDGDKAFEAVTVLLMQVFDFFGFVEGTYEIVFPFLEQLKEKIGEEDYAAAESSALALLAMFCKFRQPEGGKRKPSARLNS